MGLAMNSSNTAKQEKEKQQELSQVLAVERYQTVTINSPLPPPEWIERFAKVYPDSARCIFQAFEENSKNNRELASKNLSLLNLSQWHGFLASIALYILVAICIFRDNTELATILFSISSANIIISLLPNKKDKNDLTNKNQ
jgi:uncharacterized membrane protein